MLIPINQRLIDTPNACFLDMVYQLANCISDTQVCSLNEIEQYLEEHDTVFCVRASGMEKAHLFDKKRVILHFDDLHYWNTAEQQRRLQCFERADIILLPYYKQFIQMQEYKKFHAKATYFPFHAPRACLQTPSIPWHLKLNKALLSGRSSSVYSFRRHIAQKPSDQIDILKHPGYSNVFSHDIIGQKYYQHIASYRGGIITSADKNTHATKGFNLNYTLAKYFEIPSCGVVPFVEYTEDLEDLGFKDDENCIFITPDNYLKKIQENLNNQQIAINAKAFILREHAFANRLEILKPLL